MLAGEMSHRVKNLLAIAAGLTAITSRSAKTTADMARELTHRLTALGRAHDLVRPLPGQEGKAALLGDLLTVLLAPYDDMGAFSGRVRVSVPRMGVGEQAATTLALVVHELATNSLKYGALSSPTGTLDISCAPHDTEVVVVWTERGGPTGRGSRRRSRIRQQASKPWNDHPTWRIDHVRLERRRRHRLTPDDQRPAGEISSSLAARGSPKNFSAPLHASPSPAG